MDSDRVNRLLTLVANLAVVAGIIFLALELRQNNDLLEAQARATLTANRLNQIDRVLQPENAAIIVKASSGQPLTEDESFRFERLKHALFVSWESDFREYQEGFAENLPIDGMRRSFVAYDGLLDSWNRRKASYSDDFVQFVDKELLAGM